MNIDTFHGFSKPQVNLLQDDTWGWELTDLYVAHGEIVTNRAVPNLLNKKGVGNRVSCKCLISRAVAKWPVPNLGAGDIETKKPAPKGWLAVVDYCDKLSNLLDAIRALNLIAHEILGRGGSAKKQLLAFCKKNDHLFPE